MQTAALVGGIITALTLSLALPTLPQEDEKEVKEVQKTMDITVYDNLDLGNYDLNLDNYGEVIDLSNYEEIYDYGDLASKIEVGTLAPPIKSMTEPLTTAAVLTETPERSSATSPVNRSKGPGLSGSITDQAKLKRIDLTSNFISSVDEDSFRLLPSLQELVLPENKLTSLPELPKTLVQLDARFNMIQSSGIQPEAFKDLKRLQFLHLSDNKLEYIPVPLPEGLRSLHLQNNHIQTLHEDTFCDGQDHSHIRRALEDIRLDGNPINLSLYPNAYFCLPRLPTGHFY
nr:PREDICTED: opticin isoform X2 [Anolis carolinensis]|eukprot:XP_008107879.1 PREDICTED: opticin isoform X2 [Anolis carolinensis]